MKKVCEICHKLPAQLPDRNRMGRPVKRICKLCHGERLRGDVRHIMKLHEENDETKTSA